MAPTKGTGITSMVTRMRAAANPTSSKMATDTVGLANKNKRKAESTLTSINKKRSALGDLTNVSFQLMLEQLWYLLHQNVCLCFLTGTQ